MKEQQIFFKSERFSIEGLYASSAGPKGVVVTHPHPLMGGSMRNNVVDALVSSFYQNGFSTLRFNFRGTGRSGGAYDNGAGEQEDIKGGRVFLEENGKEEIFLAGYSFGAWVIAKLIAGECSLSDVIMISPPIDFLDFDLSGLKGKVGLIICGDSDEFCPAGRLKKISEETGCRFEVVKGAGHFYHGREDELIARLDGYLAQKPRIL